jgi:hypothetical protein
MITHSLSNGISETVSLDHPYSGLALGSGFGGVHHILVQLRMVHNILPIEAQIRLVAYRRTSDLQRAHRLTFLLVVL